MFPEDEDSDRFDRTMSVRRPAPPDPNAPAVVDKRAQDRRQSNARILFVTIVVIAVLYLAKPVVVPIALAILFAFLLTPIVSVLERTFLRRTGAIVLSLGIAVTGLSLGGWWIYQQFNAVAREIATAATSGHIEEKLRFLRRTTGGTLAAVERTLQRVSEAAEKPAERADLKVRVIPENRGIGDQYKRVAPTIEFVAALFLVVVLVFFLLQDREQLRDKMLRLAGRAHLTVTTQAIGETSERISRYLL
ncbi:MAG: AI-2E family transporter, partial [Thermoanaerobaculia bacterium]